MTTIITTAVVTLLLYGLVRLAIPEAKRRVKRGYRKHTRRLRTQKHRVLSRQEYRQVMSGLLGDDSEWTPRAGVYSADEYRRRRAA